jgi:hypothetical protein
MTTVTGLTADRMLAIEAASVVDGDVVGGNLILTKHDGSQINAGSVIGPAGPQGPIGNMLPVLSAAGILDVGLSNQIRAGRQLSPADFANIGLNAPLGLWNLSDLSDASGNGRALSNKGAVPTAPGINGVANTAAQFKGDVTQALYISDTGAADPFRIKTGSWGCWFKTAVSGNSQHILSRSGTAAAGNNFGYFLSVSSSNVCFGQVSVDGISTPGVAGVSNVCDNRWHFVVATFDSMLLRVYLDGGLEGIGNIIGSIFQSSGPLNVGSGFGADAANNIVGGMANFGRVDEAFVTADVLSEDQIRNLYCAKIPHTLATVPARISLNIRRRKKGAAFAVSDFPTQPLRLHNFSGGSLADQGSNNVPLSLVATPVNVSGADGSPGNAFNFNGTTQALLSTDAGLPSGLASLSYGGWLKTTSLGGGPYPVILWGSSDAAATSLAINSGVAKFASGADSVFGKFVADGNWHFITVTEDNGAIDTIKRKMYVDGKLVGTSNVMNAIALGGYAYFRIGTNIGGINWFSGQIDSVFVCDYVLTPDQIQALYAKGSQALSPSPKNAGSHVEGMDAANLYAIFDTLESQHQIDLAVA